MGLDMYLRAERYLSPWGDESKELMKSIHEALGVGDFNVQSGTRVSICAAYWRKANQVHAWFVDNVQDGEDDCKEYEVSREDLTNLRNLCAEVVEHIEPMFKQLKADPSLKGVVGGLEDQISEYCEATMATRSGFFFGSTDYGEYYIMDLKNTIEMLDKALTLSDDWWFEYQSSW